MVFTRITVIGVFIALVVGAKTSFAYDAQLAESSKCSRYFSSYEEAFHMPSNLIRAIGITESGRYVKSQKTNMAWPWTVNAQGKGYYFNNKREAIRAVQKFRASGIESIDVGCMQVNLKYHPEAFRSLEQAFEPKYNIGYAAKFLREKYLKAGSWKVAVGQYHNGDPAVNKGYVQQVYSAWRVADRLVDVASLGGSFIRMSDAVPDTSRDEDVSALTKNVLATFSR